MSAITDSKPITLFQAVQVLMTKSGPAELGIWMGETEEDAGSIVHHGLGRHIRNAWGLWDESSDLAKHMSACGFHHGDDRSSAILTCLHRELNKKPWRLEELVEKFKTYWRKHLNPGDFEKMYGSES